MADTAFDTSRALPLAQLVHASSGVAITPVAACFRLNLRARPEAVELLEKALDMALPTDPKTSVTKGTRNALWLGPDEWLIYDAKSDPNIDVAKVDALYSAVDISHRNTAVQISGPHAADVINAGCPQDLSLGTFGVGACSRTVFGKIEVVLHRTKPTVFRMEVWRSFSTYAFDLLQDAAKDAA